MDGMRTSFHGQAAIHAAYKGNSVFFSVYRFIMPPLDLQGDMA